MNGTRARESRIDDKRVLVLLTGGTAGMRRDPTNGSLVPGKGYLADSLKNTLSDSASSYKYPEVTVYEYSKQLDSSDMGADEWRRIASDIERNYDAYDGFVVVMGTVRAINCKLKEQELTLCYSGYSELLRRCALVHAE
jgi:L-asparaginase/Glu-tRNA(Gln) amidotransferase subunit D